MPTLLLDDLRSSIGDQLGQYAQQVQQAVTPVAQPPTAPAAPDPQDILNQLQQHAQAALAATQQAAQPAVQVLGQGQQAAGNAVQQVQQQLQDHVDQITQQAQQAPAQLGGAVQDVRQQLEQHVDSLTQQNQPPTLGGPSDQAITPTDQGAPARVGQGQSDFITSLQGLAASAAARTGIDPNAMLAIAANETGWGQSSNAQQQNNLFSLQGDGSNGSRWASTGVRSSRSTRSSTWYRRRRGTRRPGPTVVTRASLSMT